VSRLLRKWRELSAEYAAECGFTPRQLVYDTLLGVAVLAVLHLLVLVWIGTMQP